MNEAEKLLKRKAAIRKELRKIEDRLQEICEHKWVLSQVAGDGRYCTKCLKPDYCED